VIARGGERGDKETKTESVTGEAGARVIHYR
jgi:hypothetical protein